MGSLDDQSGTPDISAKQDARQMRDSCDTRCETENGLHVPSIFGDAAMDMRCGTGEIISTRGINTPDVSSIHARQCNTCLICNSDKTSETITHELFTALKIILTYLSICVRKLELGGKCVIMHLQEIFSCGCTILTHVPYHLPAQSIRNLCKLLISNPDFG